MKQKPLTLGLLLCEQIVIEEDTKNVTLVNCFTRRTVEGFPSAPVPFVVYSILTDGQGEGALEVTVQRADTLEEIYQRSVRVRFSNPLHEVRCIFRASDCSFPVPGGHLVSLLADGELIAQKRILITSLGSTQ